MRRTTCLPGTRRKILVQMHCHHRAIFSMKDEMALLNATGGDVKVLDSGCCGMAGPYGFERKSYDVVAGLGRARVCCRRSVRRSRDGHRGRRVQLPRADRAEYRPAGGSHCGSIGREDMKMKHTFHVVKAAIPSAVPRTVDWPRGGAGSTPRDCRHDGGRQSVSRLAHAGAARKSHDQV